MKANAEGQTKWRLLNKKMSPAIAEKLKQSHIEIHFLSGRGGTYSSIYEFLSQYGLPLSQVAFVDQTPCVVPWASLQPGGRYQLVITPKPDVEEYNLFECGCCGDTLASVRQSPTRCAVCGLEELCSPCALSLREDWAAYLLKQRDYKYDNFGPGSIVCMLCLQDLPAPLSPSANEHHFSFWRLRIVRYRFSEESEDRTASPQPETAQGEEGLVEN